MPYPTGVENIPACGDAIQRSAEWLVRTEMGSSGFVDIGKVGTMSTRTQNRCYDHDSEIHMKAS